MSQLNATVDSGKTKKALKTPSSNKVWKEIAKNKYLYLLLLPGLIHLILFKYTTMYGSVIAFKDYNMFKGIFASPWVGLKNFRDLFNTPKFPLVMKNTLIISLLKMLFGFPAPIILALLLNELRHIKFKKITQTIVYLPHFVSWVVFAGILRAFLNPVDGFINEIIKFFGAAPYDFLGNKDTFRSLLVVTDIYKGIGWGTIIYMAALAGVDPELYEAAKIDGANLFQRMKHITLPCIKPVIMTLFILGLGGILNAGFEQIFLLYNDMVMPVADIIDTYVYRKGIKEAAYSLGAAAGMFKSVIAMVLIILTNKIANKVGEEGVW
ncbi:carbohydrate ABC transporter membrane protein 1, CUT1 family [Clostridium amylolyticum]|uniref:Carbohydrate ABC transporter membrane protein 1, CUT1 family n=1 Tax=Clostridium amylolyticum TaxID=1121298 RepID=A0A1M6P791_9CLOT|nr:ABC transporter permease subunit [Clostridium amylolyticum]SHK03803.1 carbohydrate ABC transporter membrane protein 1, CUT1 family [Clostridium amylolyticum]